MVRYMLIAGAFTPVLTAGVALAAEPASSVFFGAQVEQFEVRKQNGEDVLAWDFDATIGTDELKGVIRSEAEYDLRGDEFETLEIQLRGAVPVSPFFDAIAGIRLDASDGARRADGVIGIHGLAQQWVEVDLDLFVSRDPSMRFEAEYEGLITNRITLVPSIEVELPLTNDASREFGAFGPIIEVGARLGYDLIDRAFSPYIGVHYEVALGETADAIRAGGGDTGALFAVIGARMMF
ncbi:MAG: copper resistance protein B [Pikeienuella sp.]